MNAYQIAAAVSEHTAVCVIDIARSFDAETARAAGVNTERLLVSQPDNDAQAFEIMESLVRSGAVDVVVVFGRLSAGAGTLRRIAAQTGTEIRGM